MATETKSELMKVMDAAQDQAHEAISAEQIKSFKVVARWWDQWFRRAGHKRLARIVLEFRDLK